MAVLVESPDQPDIRALIAELDRYQSLLYPAESNHLVDIHSLLQANVVFAVAREENGEASGCGAIVLHPSYGELKRMFVRPERRGGGVAGRLLAFLEIQASERGCDVLMLETGIRQPEAIGLYRRRGYVECPPFGSYREDPLSIFMRKDLRGR